MPTDAELGGISAYGTIVHLLFDQIAATRKIATEHGNFTTINLPGLKDRAPLIHVVGAEYAEQVLKNHDVYQTGGIVIKGYKNSLHNHLRRGYFSANGAEYEHYMKMFGPLLRKKVVEDVYPIISEVVAEQLDQWPTEETVNLIPYINILMKNLSSRGIFKDPDIVAGLHAANMVEAHGRLTGAALTSSLSARYGRPAFSRLHKRAQVAYDAVIDWAKTREGLPPSSDVLSAVVNALDETGKPATSERIVGYAWTMMGASYDTTTSALCWLFVMLATHPHVARKLYEEVQECERISGSDMKAIMELPYLDAIIKESLRLIPPVPIQRRKASVDSEISGRPVVAGSQLLISAWMTNRDPVLYPEPDIFDPDRWNGMLRSPYQWLTFSAGPRRCLGIWFATSFLKAITASMITRWRPEIVDGARISMNVSVTVRAGKEIPAVLRKHSGKFRASRLSGNVHNYLRLCSWPLFLFNLACMSF